MQLQLVGDIITLIIFVPCLQLKSVSKVALQTTVVTLMKHVFVVSVWILARSVERMLSVALKVAVQSAVVREVFTVMQRSAASKVSGQRIRNQRYSLRIPVYY